MSDQEITLLLIGRTGHGKSSTGNSILREKVFPPRGITSNMIDSVQEAKREIEGKTVRVVDGSNIGETDDEYPDNARELIRLSDEAFKLCNKRFNALVLLLKYGAWFTKQERDAVLVIKSLFGSDVIQRHGVIVMTGGDHFARDAEDNGITFQQWCDQQTGDVYTLMKECGQRIVLFDNKTQNVDTLWIQREELIAKVKEIFGQTGPYTEEDWERSEQGRRKLLVMPMMLEMEEETDDFVEDMARTIGLLRASEATDPSANLRQITKLLGQLQQFEERLKLRDQGTGSVTSLIERLDISRISLTMMNDRLEKKVHGTGKSNAQYSVGGQGTSNTTTRADESSSLGNKKSEEGCCCLTCCCCCLSCNQKCADRYCCLACLFSIKVFCIRQ